jgi:putative membrane protein insertion efficiency factor
MKEDNVSQSSIRSGADGRTLTWRPAGFLIAAMSGLFDFYHVLIAPLLTTHSGLSCRFEPTCSRYARTAMLRFGVGRGGYLTLRRLARCHPLGGYGYDPVPDAPSAGSGNH